MTPPMRVWMCDGERDVRVPLELELGFEFDSGTSGNGKGKQVAVAAKIDSLGDADAFLEFALARGRAPKWSKVEGRRSRLDGGSGAWVVQVVLVRAQGEEVVAVKVTASAKPKARISIGSSEKEKEDRTADVAELCGKMEVIRALIRPSEATTDFLSLIDERLAGMDDGFVDDEEDESMADSDQVKDQQGIDLFSAFRSTHPRGKLAVMERKFRGIGDLEFIDTCAAFADVMEKGAATTASGERVGFGRWNGDIALSLRKSLGVSCLVRANREGY